MKAKLKVFYSENQQVDTNSSFSPSAGKPKKVLEDWKKHNLPIKVIEPSPLSRSDLALAHDPKYIKGLLDLEISNGFGNRNADVARSLPWTTGSFASAAQYAIRNNTQAVSLTSGFHHSCYDSGGGFCTLNGLVIAAQLLKLHGYAKKVGICDLDSHWGDGTAHIIKKLDLDYIEHYSVGGDNRSGAKVLKALPGIFKKQFKNCDIVLIQLGADACSDDPLGHKWTLEQMRLRDRIVFQQCKKYNLPLVWNLAGGYQDNFENVLSLHRISAEEYFNVFHGIKLDTDCEKNYEKPKRRIPDCKINRDDDIFDAVIEKPKRRIPDCKINRDDDIFDAVINDDRIEYEEEEKKEDSWESDIDWDSWDKDKGWRVG